MSSEVRTRRSTSCRRESRTCSTRRPRYGFRVARCATSWRSKYTRGQGTQSSLMFFEVGDAGLSNAEFLGEMLRAGVRMGQVRGQIRAVTHLDVSAEDIELSLRAAEGIVKSGPRGNS